MKELLHPLQPDNAESIAAAAQKIHALTLTARQDAIVEAVMSAGTMRIEDLADRFNVSRMTIHRDIETLEAKAVLRRSRGSVTAIASSLFEASIEYRNRQNRDEKDAIAAVAADLIEPGEAIILDDSTTGLRLVPYLSEREPLTVITNFGRMQRELEGRRGINLISTGGEYSTVCDAYRGALTLRALQGLAADTYFLSAAAVTGDVCYHPHQDIVLAKQAMLQAARRKILIVDHSKFSRRALHAIAPISEFDIVIVDSNIDPADLRRLRQSNVDVRIAQVSQVDADETSKRALSA